MWNASADADLTLTASPVTVPRPVRPFAIEPDKWRAPADGPRWLYAQPGRLRAIWRLTAFGLALLVFQPVTESILAPLFGVMSRAVGEPVAAYPWITLTSVVAALVLALRVIDEVPWRAAALGEGTWRPRVLLFGLLLGAAAITFTVVALWATGSAHIQAVSDSLGAVGTESNTWAPSALRVAMVLAPAALWEELVFRGYLWSVAEDAGGVALARWATAVAFGAVHVLNPGAGLWSTAVVTLAGFCLGAVRERTGSLGAAWLAHFAWNWVMAAVLHVPVSGMSFEMPGYRTVVRGATWWTGGEWGPEGGGAALLVMSGALLLSMQPAGLRLFRTRSSV
ncbi:MAG: CPBP family intramembrane metalloprotease [Gemmatimonadaceae bacterium]|nr:CPBP family intramembrane metalloprotease [Gemmatimonadaceae bacterium]